MMVNYHFRMGVKGLMKFSKPSLIKFIIKHELKKLPKKRLAVLYYELMKSRLPRLSIRKRKQLAGIRTPTYQTLKFTSKRQYVKPKTKRKFSRKQLAAQRLFAKRARAGTLKRRRR